MLQVRDFNSDLPNLVPRVLRLPGRRVVTARDWRSEKKSFFDFPFTVTNLRSGNRRISAVKIPVLPLSKKPADSGYEIAVCRELSSGCSITADTTSQNHLNETYTEWNLWVVDSYWQF